MSGRGHVLPNQRVVAWITVYRQRELKRVIGHTFFVLPKLIHTGQDNDHLEIFLRPLAIALLSAWHMEWRMYSTPT